MKMASIEFAQISKNKETLFLLDSVDNSVLFPLKTDGSSKENKTWKQVSKAKDTNSVAKNRYKHLKQSLQSIRLTATQLFLLE
jgi:hypothetical protein